MRFPIPDVLECMHFVMESSKENKRIIRNYELDLYLGGEREVEEDTLCAEYIAALLCGMAPDIAEQMEDLKNTSGAKFFLPEMQEIFPEADFHMCVQLNRFPFVLRVVREDGLNRVERVQ